LEHPDFFLDQSQSLIQLPAVRWLAKLTADFRRELANKSPQGQQSSQAFGEVRTGARLAQESGCATDKRQREDGTMFVVSKNEEIAVRDNEESDVSALMALAYYRDLEILAMRSYCDRDGVVLLLVTNDSPRTRRVLEQVGYQCRTRPVVLVGPLDRRGCATPLQTELEASGIHVRYSYAHRTEQGDHYLAFKTEDDDRALRVLEVSSTLHGAARLKDDQPSRVEELHQIAA
jgi:hypothetical protein